MMSILSPLLVAHAVIMTICVFASKDKVDNMTILGFQCVSRDLIDTLMLRASTIMMHMINIQHEYFFILRIAQLGLLPTPKAEHWHHDNSRFSVNESLDDCVPVKAVC